MKAGEKMIALNEKKNFLKYFLNNFQLQKRECGWMLNYIYNHEDLLNNTHFVDDVKECQRAIVMSATCENDEPAFAGIIEGQGTIDAEKMFHYIRMNREDLYIQLNFHDKMKNEAFISVLEENPYKQTKLSKKYGTEAKAFLDFCFESFRKDALMKEIDKALEEGNQEEFIRLSEEYRRLNNEQEQK